MHKIYFLINQWRTKTYTGQTNNFEQRMQEHKNGKVKSTKNFDTFEAHILEEVDTLKAAIKREKYWKSCAGRKKIKKIFFRKL
ncbi:GIY-YIG nuclease family protein [Candidatus Falkowbacteria bacterium]|nr:GIY-YIG nuclease family protein [Candidatus Falkowbacteria bacterium]MBT7348783.1 GIY-YIG nuclease family protein [Candidatus Falkowbacteria bacterium]MBT7500759.1 GIY-YIG nuclease family protein [Candidatus Falkowbacteria bacterium]